MFTQITESLVLVSLFAFGSHSADDLHSLCVLTYDDFGYYESARFAFGGGCSEHFQAGLWQDNTGEMTFPECSAKCTELNCQYFSYGKQGVSRENWCNIYTNVVCTESSDKDWHTFIPESTEGLAPSAYAVKWNWNGGCQEHFEASILYKDESGSSSFSDCYFKCKEDLNCASFTFGTEGGDRPNWCTLYDVECTNNGDLNWDTYVTISNSELACDTYDCT